MVVLPRVVKERNRGRLRMSRYSSAGEERKRNNRCLKCGKLGHYQKSCRSQSGSNKEIHQASPKVDNVYKLVLKL